MSFTSKRSFEIKNIKQPLGLLVCVAALFFIISCSSSQRTSSIHSTPLFYPHTGPPHTFEGGARELGAVALVVVAIVVIPLAIESLGELLGAIFEELGLQVVYPCRPIAIEMSVMSAGVMPAKREA